MRQGLVHGASAGGVERGRVSPKLVASQQWHQVLARQAAAVESTIRTGPVTPKRFF
ncbi:UNVERIFIED_ORG: hypothetical protein FHR63_003447 [Xanthomonas campestris]